MEMVRIKLKLWAKLIKKLKECMRANKKLSQPDKE